MKKTEKEQVEELEAKKPTTKKSTKKEEIDTKSEKTKK